MLLNFPVPLKKHPCFLGWEFPYKLMNLPMYFSLGRHAVVKKCLLSL